MHKHGVMNKRVYDKITRELGVAGPETTKSLTAAQIRALRTKANLSQAVFAQAIGVTPGYVSRLERGATRPTGSILILLNVLRVNGVNLVL